MRKIALITGGATGLGYYISEQFVKKGIDVCLVGRREEKLKEAKEILMKLSTVDVEYAVGNVSDEDFVKNLFSSFEKEEIHVEYLVNCAGTGKFGPVEKNTKEMIEIAFDASLTGLILMSSRGVEHMNQKGGFIVNVMSTAALRGKANETIYCAAKWGARGFTEALKEAVKGTKTKVIGVYPGGMNTEFWSPDCGMNLDTSKLMNPAEVADVIVYNLLDRSNMYVSDITIDRK